MWVLVLNDMRASNIENVSPRFRAETREELEAFLARESVEGYRDGQWGKAFRAGGPLEWFNPPGLIGGIFDAGTRGEWMEEGGRRWDQQVGCLPTPG